MVGAMPTPDLVAHPARAIRRAALDSSGIVTIDWGDGVAFRCLGLWLYEQSVGVEPVSRETTIDPGFLPAADVLRAVEVTPAGALLCRWSDGDRTEIDPGWLRHVAVGGHLPHAAIGEPVVWRAADGVGAFEWSAVGTDPAAFEAWLARLCTHGAVRLSGTPIDDDFLEGFARRLGPIRGSNFGDVFTVESSSRPDSTANTSLGLGQHTDLPTRERPPGFQLLHCVESTVDGGWNRLTDGHAVVEVLCAEHPDDHDVLSTFEWVFANRAVDGDHRWIGPIIDRGGPRDPLTLRAFYPVRLAPHGPVEEHGRAYEALRTFSRVAHDPRLMVAAPFEAGDLIAFDNRRVLHGRTPFESSGRRRLRGCYLERDDVLSRRRVLGRPAAVPTTEHGGSHST